MNSNSKVFWISALKKKATQLPLNLRDYPLNKSQVETMLQGSTRLLARCQ